MGGRQTISRSHCPTVGFGANTVSSPIYHGLDADRKARFQFSAFTVAAEVRYQGILMEATTDTVTYQLAYDTESIGFADRLNGGADIAQPVSSNRF